MKLWWCYQGRQEAQEGPWREIKVCEAATPQEACAAFSVAFPSPFVHELTSPKVIAAAPSDRKGVWTARVSELPSVYDQFRRPGFGWGAVYDLEAMEDQGFDPR